MRTGRGIVLVAVGCLVITGQAAASGFYNMPTSLQQCLGVGFGPGYHAPMLLGPMMKSRIASQRLKRLPHALSPPPQACFGEPSRLEHAYQPQVHGYNLPPQAGYGLGMESYMAPAIAPAPVPSPVMMAPTVPAAPESNAEVVPAPEPVR